MADVIRILIADDHPVVRGGLRSFLSTIAGLEVVGEASDGVEAVRKATELAPDVILMDLSMPNMDGIEAIKRIAGSGPKIIALTSFATDDKVFPAIEAGADGYLLKETEPAELADAIAKVHRGELIVHPTIAARLMQQVAAGTPKANRTDLTARELDVLRHIARGMSNREIGKSLGVAEKTVKNHVSHLLAKLGLADRTQAALYAVEHNLAHPS